jgi:hypothetical protein
MNFIDRSKRARRAGFNGSGAATIRNPDWLCLLMIGTVVGLSPCVLAGQANNPGVESTRETLSLNGTWKIAFDTENTGKDQHWYEHFPLETTPIRVPSVWNEIRPNYQGLAWYQTSFLAPSRWKGSSVRIGFGAVSYLAEVWLNGKYLGDHEGGYTPFEFEAGDNLLWDQQNQLVARVLLPMRTLNFMSGLKWVTGKRIDGMVLEEIPASKQIWYDNFGGIWQDVHVEVTRPTWVQDCFIRPNIYEGKIDVTCNLINHTGQDKKITLALAASEKTNPTIEVARQSREIDLASGAQQSDLSLPMPNTKLWSPDHPFLYRLQVRLLDNGHAIDSRQFTFGMRDFTIRNNQFFLNGQPIILKAAIYQPHYPQTLAYPPYEGMLAADIRMAREAHLNMLRLHIKPEVPRLLELADEQGILLYEEPPIGWIQKSPQMRERCRREVRELIARDRNHPALVMWGALNEGAAEGEELKTELAAYAHELDPTRLVFDDSGGVYYSGENSRVFIPGSTLPRAINDIHPYMLQPFSNASFNYYHQMQEPHMLNFTSEFGAMGGIEDLDAVIARYEPGREWQDKDRLEEIYALFRKGFNDQGLDKWFGDFAAFARSSRDAQAEALTRMIDALRMNPLTAGYDICHWNDANFEFPFGLVDEWRNPKPSYTAARAANTPLHIIVSTARSNFYAGEPLDGELTLVNDEGHVGKVEINLQVSSADGNVLQKQTRAMALGPRVKSLGSFRLVAPFVEGDFRLSATLNLDGKLLDRTEHKILVLRRLRPRGETITDVGILDPGGGMAGRLQSLPIKVSRYRADAPAQSIYMVGPLADSLYDYPLAELKGLVDLAHRGASLVLLELPNDAGQVSDKFGVFPTPLKVDFPEGFKTQWIRAHAITAGLPSSLVLDQRYADVLPARFLDMRADETVGGVLLNSFGDYHRRWFQSLVINEVDKGHIIICQYRLLENLGKDPLADRLFMNLIAYAQSISHKPEAPLGNDRQEAFNQQVVDQQKQVQGDIQRWAVVGPFDNRGRDGLDREYSPEKEFRFDKSYLGKNGGVTWRPVTVWSADRYYVNMDTRFDDWTVNYAYTQVYSPQETETRFKLTCQQGCRLWLNGNEIIYSDVFGANDNTAVPVTLRAGWNPVLVKVDRTKMQHSFFELDVRSKSGELIPGLKFDFAGQQPKALSRANNVPPSSIHN